MDATPTDVFDPALEPALVVDDGERFTVEALDAANAGTDGYSSFYPGLVIVIPAKTDC